MKTIVFCLIDTAIPAIFFDRADNTTLFRTLKTFLKYKLIHTIEDGTGLIKYALCQEGCTCSPEDLHSHFHCTQCKQTFCLTDTVVPVVSLPKNFHLQEINLVLKGICDTCS
ncbi:MAG: transcriptional repressor [Flavobacteriaceae bacterium]|nr:MAG: transcriptional repressor [Flavobacteriaceae bacterium]